MRAETCFDPREEEPHACPGRCVCYVNHWCNPGCACNHCGLHRVHATPSHTHEYALKETERSIEKEERSDKEEEREEATEPAVDPTAKRPPSRSVPIGERQKRPTGRL